MISKSAAALAATGVGGTGAAAVGGAYYLGAFEGKDSTTNKHPTNIQQTSNKHFRALGRRMISSAWIAFSRSSTKL